MFYVINKDKIYSYLVTLSVIGILFGMSTIIPRNEVVETSSKMNIIYENTIEMENNVNI